MCTPAATVQLNRVKEFRRIQPRLIRSKLAAAPIPVKARRKGCGICCSGLVPVTSSLPDRAIAIRAAGQCCPGQKPHQQFQ